MSIYKSEDFKGREAVQAEAERLRAELKTQQDASEILCTELRSAHKTIARLREALEKIALGTGPDGRIARAALEGK